jgi:hypothetical protein
VVGGAVNYKTIQESNVDASWRYSWRYETVCWVEKSLHKPKSRIGGARWYPLYRSASELYPWDS